MRNDKIRRFRPRSNKFRSRRPINSLKSNNGVSHQFNNQRNGSIRNHIPRNPHNLERIIEKYKTLAKEALSIGDKILYENYLQHSDHFSRILSEVLVEKSKNNTNDEKSVQQSNTSIINK